MVLIFSHTTSARLQYICRLLFTEMMGLEHAITIDGEYFRNFDGVKINYSDTDLGHDSFRIPNQGLLFEKGIRPQPIACFETNGYKAFFQMPGTYLPFDILSASFYLVSRYEEYLPHQKDMYGRYAHENSLAFREDFLKLPLVNIWVKDLVKKLSATYAGFAMRYARFKFVPTYDIDIAYSYKHKGLLRNMAGFFRSPSAERLQVLAGYQKDPFNSYAWLDALHETYDLHPIYFFLVARKNGRYDKNILPHKEAMWKLVKHHTYKYRAGLHPSWQCGDNLSQLKKEKQQLEAMGETGISASRQHYIRFSLPEGYRSLLKAGISVEHSMGYGSINGFRASIASAFDWYDLENDEATSLRIHPFCFMDANSYYEQKFSLEETARELWHYYEQCMAVQGILITIFHNNFLGTNAGFRGWRELYEHFIARVMQ